MPYVTRSYGMIVHVQPVVILPKPVVHTTRFAQRIPSAKVVVRRNGEIIRTVSKAA